MQTVKETKEVGGFVLVHLHDPVDGSVYFVRVLSSLIVGNMNSKRDALMALGRWLDEQRAVVEHALQEEK